MRGGLITQGGMALLGSGDWMSTPRVRAANIDVMTLDVATAAVSKIFGGTADRDDQETPLSTVFRFALVPIGPSVTS